MVVAIGLALGSWQARAAGAISDAPSYDDLAHPAHLYYQRPLHDRFTRIKADLESGRVPLDQGSEKSFLISLLKVLGVSPHSQMLVFSTTSLQLSLISPSNPRALYFNDEIYLGYVPGGRLEIVSLDPVLGGIYYLMDFPSPSRPMKIERSERCMNCHAAEETGYVPGLVIKSVIPAPGGGSLTSYRVGKTGHDIPLSQRFGGWHITGQPSFTQHWGNLTGRSISGRLETYPLTAGSRFDWARYAASTSDLLPQLLHEHQAGFANRVLEAGYRARLALHLNPNGFSPAQEVELEEQSERVVRYLLFADEAPLPDSGIQDSPDFRADFQKAARRATSDGLSLRDLDLKTRLLRYRCSYMIYSPIFQELASPLRLKIYRALRRALSLSAPQAAYSYLLDDERRSILRILEATLPEFRGLAQRAALE